MNQTLTETNDSSTSPNHPLRILLLEDMDIDAELVMLQLDRSGDDYDLDHAKNKREYFEKLENGTYDLIISDYALPQFTGMEAVKHLRQSDPYTAFIICTGSVNEETAVACIKAGADDYVLKDSLGRLTSAISTSLKSKATLIERDRAEIELKASEENFRALAENAPDNLYKLKPDGTILYVNRNADGLSIQELQGMNILDRTSDENREILRNAIQQSFSEKTNLTIEITGDPSVKNSKWYSCNIGPVLDKKGNVDSLIFIPHDITARKRAELEMIELNERLSNLTRHLHNVTDEEKKKIAMEIHDQLGQELTGHKLGLFWIQQHIKQNGIANANEGELMERINHLIDLNTQTIQTVRRIAHELRPVVLDDMGLLAALEWYVENFNKNPKCQCDLELNVPNVVFNKDISTTLYRIVQEGLTNINRHAKASWASVNLIAQEKTLTLTIEDNGVGTDKEKALQSTSMGLFGMRERLKTWQGHWDMRTAPGAGTKIIIQIPLKNLQL